MRATPLGASMNGWDLKSSVVKTISSRKMESIAPKSLCSGRFDLISQLVYNRNFPKKLLRAMAGHSKWANIKHRKGRADAIKGKIFSRLVKEIISAVKQGGPDPKSNSKLRLVLQKARVANLPSDNIERNIKKATSADQADYIEMSYELYGHGGVGI